MKTKIREKIWKAKHEKTNDEVCLGFLRYEALKNEGITDEIVCLYHHSMNGEFPASLDAHIDELIGGEK